MKARKINGLLCLLVILLAVFSGCSSQQKVKDVSLQEIFDAVKNAYGDTYLPDSEIPEELLNTEFPLDSSLVEEIKGEMPMVSFHPDRVVVVKAKEGKGEDVEKALNEIKENIIENSLQYPANLAKVKSSQVVRHGDYVVFLLVGGINDNIDASEEDALKFAQDETAKAVAAVNKLFES